MNQKIVEIVKKYKPNRIIFESVLMRKTGLTRPEIQETMNALTEYGVVVPAYHSWCDQCDENAGSFTKEEINNSEVCCPFCYEKESVFIYFNIMDWVKVKEF